ncbi:MAG TPA: hypothetical protein VHO25_22110 [Polyangiaceae bacterium]|nr:hypothetical protein [Polyangiaceae bacterium]
MSQPIIRAAKHVTYEAVAEVSKQLPAWATLKDLHEAIARKFIDGGHVKAPGRVTYQTEPDATGICFSFFDAPAESTPA